MGANMPTATVNAGVGFQLLKDNPDLARDVTKVRVDGLSDAHGVTLHVAGDHETVELWADFLGPAARVHARVPFGDGWEQGVSTVDTVVVVRHRVDGAGE